MNGVLKLYTVGVAIVAGGAVAIAVDAREELAQAHQQNAAWQQETSQWQTVAARAVAHDRSVTQTHNALVKRYQDLARAAKAAAAIPRVVTAPAVAPASPAVAPAVSASATTRTS
jgi:hypothetical protein